MFTYGNLDANNTPGLMGLLAGIGQLAAPSQATVTSPGRDGAFFAHASLGSGAWVFDLTATGRTPAEVLAVTDEVALHLDPRHGLQPLTMSIAPGWIWQAVLDSELSWTRGLWVIGQECQLNAQASFTTPDSHAYANPDDTASRTGAGPLLIDRTQGNAPSHPQITITGSLTASQHVTIAAGDYVMRCNGPLDPDQELRLDYRNLDFGIWFSRTKTHSAVPRMNNYARLQLDPGPTTITVSTTGTINEVRVAANSRRS